MLQSGISCPAKCQKFRRVSTHRHRIDSGQSGGLRRKSQLARLARTSPRLPHAMRGTARFDMVQSPAHAILAATATRKNRMVPSTRYSSGSFVERKKRSFGSLFLALKAEALHLADRTSEALVAITEAEALIERSEARCWCAELHRLRGAFLTALGADETQIEASFRKAIRIAQQQKSVSLAKRAEATYAEYSRQKANASGGRGFRLPLC